MNAWIAIGLVLVGLVLAYFLFLPRTFGATSKQATLGSRKQPALPIEMATNEEVSKMTNYNIYYASGGKIPTKSMQQFQ